MPDDTPTRRLASVLLGAEGPLEDWVRARRDEGRAWRLIARDLYEATGLDVTHETLRTWFGRPLAAAPASSRAVS